MSEFNSDDHYIYYCRQESLRRSGVVIMVNKRVLNAVLGCNLKNDRMISIHFQDKKFNIMVIQACAPTSNAKECSNHHTIALISHASKVMLKIRQARLQQYMNHELPNVQAEFSKGRETRDQNCQHLLNHRKSKRVAEKYLLPLY